MSATAPALVLEALLLVERRKLEAAAVAAADAAAVAALRAEEGPWAVMRTVLRPMRT